MDYLYTLNPTAMVIVSISIMIVCGFLVSRLTKLIKLPNVTGYIIAGVLIGPQVLHLIPSALISSFDFLTDIAIAFIAFGVGKYIDFSTFKQTGLKNFLITVCEVFLTALLVCIVMKFAFGLTWEFSIMIGTIASTTAPTSTFMTIRQYRARGNFINTLVQTIAMNGIVSLLLFNICLVLFTADHITFWNVSLPLLYSFGTVALGIAGGFLLKKLISANFSTDSQTIMTFAILFSLTAISCLLEVSPLLACMALGASYVSLKGEKQLFKQISAFTPPILLLFFVASGMRLDLTDFLNLGLVSIAYVLVRILGKVAGSTLGGLLTKANKNVVQYLGFALLPQASISVGLAAVVQRVLPDAGGQMLVSIILTSALIFELIGPMLSKWAIFASKSVSQNVNDGGFKRKTKLTPIELYIQNQIETNSLEQQIIETTYQAKTKSDIKKLKRIMKELKKTKAFEHTVEIELDGDDKDDF